MCLLVVAACLAFMGLVENSSVVLVASMLVSPLMGPILAIVFGTAVRNRKLVRSRFMTSLLRARDHYSNNVGLLGTIASGSDKNVTVSP